MKSNKSVAIPTNIDNMPFEPSRAWCQKILDVILEIQEAHVADVEAHHFLERESVQLGKTKVFLRKVCMHVCMGGKPAAGHAFSSLSLLLMISTHTHKHRWLMKCWNLSVFHVYPKQPPRSKLSLGQHH